MAAPLRVRDEFLHPLGGRSALNGDGEGDLLEGRPGPVQPELVPHVKAAANIYLRILDGDIVKRREPRHLGEESEGGPN